MRHASCLAAAVMSIMGCSDAADEAPSPNGPGVQNEEPAPSPNVDALYGALAGSWACETTFPAGAQGPGSPEIQASGTLTVAEDLGGFWYRGVYETKETPTMPVFRVEFFLGYGAGTDLAFLVGVDNIGGTSTATSAGWDGDVLTYEGTGYAMGYPVATRESMTRHGTDEVIHRLELDVGAGYEPKVESVCSR